MQFQKIIDTTKEEEKNTPTKVMEVEELFSSCTFATIRLNY